MTTAIDRKGAESLVTAQRDARLRQHTPRVELLHSLVKQRMNEGQDIWGYDLTVLDDPATSLLPLKARRAKARELILLEMPIAIEEDDLIVGNCVRDGVIVRPMLPEYATEEEYDRARQGGHTMSTSMSHKTPYYADVMNMGLAGIIERIDAKITEIDRRPPSMERDDKLVLFQTMRIECSAVITMAHRYAALAERLASSHSSPTRRAELARIAEVCRRVPENPPTTFHEAVQSFWFVHHALYSTQSILSCGRLDQFLFPVLERDLDAETLSLEEAQELVDCLWLKFNDRTQLQRDKYIRLPDGGSVATDPDGRAFRHQMPSPGRHGRMVEGGTRTWKAGHRDRVMMADDVADAVNHWGQNILLSGLRPDGTDGTNTLTYLCLNAHDKFSFTNPVLTVRLHKDSPPELVRRVAEVLKEDGSGMPYVNNDDVIIKAYTDLGVPLEDARDYVNSNCWETMIQGKSDQEMIRGVNFLLLLELALHRGCSALHGQMGPDTGDPQDFATFDQLMAAWKSQMDHLVREGIDYVGSRVTDGTIEHSGHGLYNSYPLVSSLSLDCVEEERDVTQGGARYTLWHVMGEALANAIDSLAAIKKLVYEEGILSMEELIAALDANWEGHEAIRQMMVTRAPKFANDSDYADELGREMMDYFLQQSRFCAEKWHPRVIFPCSVGTFSWVRSVGKEVAATPDGRHAGDPVAANMSPAPGADQSGPVAAINSSVKMRAADLAAGAPLDLRLSKAALLGEDGTRRLAGVIQGFVAVGGNMLTLTVTDVEELRTAMREPENYRHLRVRMGGWSAYFVMLSKEQQLLQIQRGESGLV